MSTMETDIDDEETSPKTIKSDKRESGLKSEREYALRMRSQQDLH